MQAKGYRFAVAWIARNDEPSELELEAVAGFISTLLVADLFGQTPEKVASDVIRFRKANPS